MSSLAHDQGKYSDYSLTGGLLLPNNSYLSSGFFSVNYSGEDRLLQEMFHSDNASSILGQFINKANESYQDLYASMATFYSYRRRTAMLQEVNIIWIDFDFYKTSYGNLSVEKFNELLKQFFDEAGIPKPSFTISSGRGLYTYWLLEKPLPRQALPRWKAVMRELCKKFKELGADINACLPTQIMRVVGSKNMKVPQWYPELERTVRVIECHTDYEDKPKRFDFEYLAEIILPYTREEVIAYREAFKSNKYKFEQYAENAKKYEEYLKSIRRGPLTEFNPELRLIIDSDDARKLWWARLEAMRKIASLAGGIEDGHGRNNWCWIGCNAMSYMTPNSQLRFDTAAIINEMIPSYSIDQIKRSASAISNRVLKGEAPYRMYTETFCKHLGISEQTLKENMPKKGTVNVGIMNFPKMADLTFENYRRETIRRQSLSAGRTNLIKSERNLLFKEKAKLMYLEGKSKKSIAKELGFDPKSIRKWLK